MRRYMRVRRREAKKQETFWTSQISKLEKDNVRIFAELQAARAEAARLRAEAAGQRLPEQGAGDSIAVVEV